MPVVVVVIVLVVDGQRQYLPLSVSLIYDLLKSLHEDPLACLLTSSFVFKSLHSDPLASLLTSSYFPKSLYGWRPLGESSDPSLPS